MAAMFFEICKYPYNILFLLGQRYCIPNFKLIGPPVYSLQFFQSSRESRDYYCSGLIEIEKKNRD